MPTRDGVAAGIFLLVGALSLGVNYLPPDMKTMPAVLQPVPIRSQDDIDLYNARMGNIGGFLNTPNSDDYSAETFTPRNGHRALSLGFFAPDEETSRTSEDWTKFRTNLIWIWTFNEEDAGDVDSRRENISAVWDNSGGTLAESFATVYLDESRTEAIFSDVLLHEDLLNDAYYYVVPDGTQIVAPMDLVVQNFDLPATGAYPLDRVSNGILFTGRTLQQALRPDGGTDTYLYTLTFSSMDRWWYGHSLPPTRDLVRRGAYPPPEQGVTNPMIVRAGEVIGFAGISSIPSEPHEDVRLLNSENSTFMGGKDLESHAIIRVSVRRSVTPLTDTQLLAYDLNKSSSTLPAMKDSTLYDFYSNDKD